MLAAVNKAVLIKDKTMSQFTCMRNVYFTYTHAQLKVSRATPRSRVLVSPSLELYVSTPLADAGGSTEPPFCVRAYTRANGNYCAHARELLTRTLARLRFTRHKPRCTNHCATHSM